MHFQEKKLARLLSLDVFRGMTVALMIIVNSPGNQKPYSWLAHSYWNGCSLADLVFPFFLFIVGVSLVFLLTKAKEKGLALNEVFPQIFKRSLILFGIGLLMNAYPHHFDWATLRILGVLQRIAICYFIASLIFFTTRIQTQVVITFLILIAYWIIMTTVPVPYFGANNLTPEGNVAAYIDKLLIPSNHLYTTLGDPEGFLSTFPALTTTMLGVLTGSWLLSPNTPQTKLYSMGFVGILALASGWLWGLCFPINKALWTSSFVLWTAGFALIIYAICYWLIEIKSWKKWANFFLIFGTNAMLAYVLHVFFLKTQAIITIDSVSGGSRNLRIFITEQLFGWTSLPNAALLYAVSYTLLWVLVLTIPRWYSSKQS